MNKITVNFALCDPAPSAGYNIRYKPAGSVGENINAGNFFISPAVFYDTSSPPGTLYEGYIRSDCGGVSGGIVPWTSVVGIEDSATPPPPVCKLHEFALFGGDGENWHITGLLCNGDIYDVSGIVGDGNPDSMCLQVGSTNFHGTPVVLINDTNPCP